MVHARNSSRNRRVATCFGREREKTIQWFGRHADVHRSRWVNSISGTSVRVSLDSLGSLGIVCNTHATAVDPIVGGIVGGIVGVGVGLNENSVGIVGRDNSTATPGSTTATTAIIAIAAAAAAAVAAATIAPPGTPGTPGTPTATIAAPGTPGTPTATIATPGATADIADDIAAAADIAADVATAADIAADVAAAADIAADVAAAADPIAPDAYAIATRGDNEGAARCAATGSA